MLPTKESALKITAVMCLALTGWGIRAWWLEGKTTLLPLLATLVGLYGSMRCAVLSWPETMQKLWIYTTALSCIMMLLGSASITHSAAYAYLTGNPSWLGVSLSLMAYGCGLFILCLVFLAVATHE